MKLCTSCKTEIHLDARKCSHCQSYQKWWYVLLPLLPIFLIFPFFMLVPRFMFNTSSFDPIDFEELEGKVTFEKISEEKTLDSRDLPVLKILLELKNNTEENLESPNFEVTFKNEEGELIDIVNQLGYQIKLPANEQVKNFIRVPISGKPENFQTEIRLIEVKKD